jgi:general secretion pathway protein M
MKEQFLTFWRSRDPREQKIIAVGGFLLVLVLLYAYLWLPMSQQRERLRLQLPVMNGQLAQMKTQAREIAQLKASAAAAQRGSVAEILNQSAAPAAIKGELTQVTPIANDRAQVTLNSVEFDKWLGWVKILQTQYALRIESTQIASATEPGMVKVQAVFVSPAQ